MSKTNYVYMPVRTIADYTPQDFVAICEHFKNSIFTYKFLGVDNKAFRTKAVNSSCYYPKNFKTDKGMVPNPDYNPHVPELAIIRNPNGINPNIYITDISEVDTFIRNMHNDMTNHGMIPVEAMNKLEEFINSLMEQKLSAVGQMISEKFELLFKAIDYSQVVSSPEFKSYLEFKDGTSESFKEFCRFKLEGRKALPASKDFLVAKNTRDEIAKRLGFPTTDEWMNLLKNYDSYAQIAKMKNAHMATVQKWAAFHGIYSSFAENRHG